MADRGGGGEAGEVADRDRCLGGAEGVGGGRPAGAHHDRDVVRAAEGGGEGSAAVAARASGSAGRGLAHAGTLTQPDDPEDRVAPGGTIGRMPAPGNDAPTQPTLEGRRVRLRPWRPDDAGGVRRRARTPRSSAGRRCRCPYPREHAERIRGRDRARHRGPTGGALFAVEPSGRRPAGRAASGCSPPRDGVRRASATGPRAGAPGPRVHRRRPGPARRMGARRPGRCAASSCTPTPRTPVRCAHGRERRVYSARASCGSGRSTAAALVDDVLYALLASDPRAGRRDGPPAGVILAAGALAGGWGGA